jgi:galactose mutarotase-like enzyme
LCKIANEYIEVTIKEDGAELTSIKYKDTEYLWNGDPVYWKRHAPVLFPIVGMLKENKYKIDGKEFSMSQHGFARDMKFSIVEANITSVSLLLKSDLETKEKYPFDFELYITYKLKGREVITEYKVVNIGDKEMFFSIGAHPAFSCPIKNSKAFSGYYIEFEKEETQQKRYVEDGLSVSSNEPFLRNERFIKLSKNSFDDDAMVFKNLNSKKVWLKLEDSNKSICVKFGGFPYLGIWSKKEGAPFICIEPWYGIADNNSHDGDFTKKEGIMNLGVNRSFECNYSIEVE